MNFYFLILIYNLIIPLCMIIGGYLMYKHHSKNVNNFVGYRTALSKKNSDTWKFANEYCGKLWLKIGAVTAVLTIVVQIPFAHSGNNVLNTLYLISVGVQIIIILGSVWAVEKKLKSVFDENGNRRHF